MKDINFIKTLSAKEQHNLHRWIIFSASIIGLTIVAIALLQIPQLYTLNQIKKEYQQLTRNIHNANTQLTQNQSLKNRMCCLGDQCKTIDSLGCITQKSHTCMECITNACGDTITIETCTIQNKKFTLAAHCAHIQQATQFIQQLQNNNNLSAVQLISLQPSSGNQISFNIKGSINS